MIFLSEEEVKSLLNWNDTLKATEAAMKAASTKKSVLPERVFSQILDTPKWMLTMSGYLQDEHYGSWACKILTRNPENMNSKSPISSLNANIMLFDENTAVLKAVLSAVEITNWRTAAASAVATKYLLASTQPQKILSIFGCGDQGRAHAHCFFNCFKFEEIRLWNRTSQRATNLAEELNKKYQTSIFRAISEKEDCARGSDVIVTATSPGSAALLKYEWLRKGIHINAVGVVGSNLSEQHYEIDQETYKHAHVYIDNWAGANKELAGLKQLGVELKAEVGEVILGNIPKPDKEQLTVFQSLGMASEDCAMARLIYDLYIGKQREIQRK